MKYIFLASLCVTVISLLSMEHIESSHLFPQIIVSAEVCHLLDLQINRKWGGQKKEQLRLLRHLESSCFAEKIMSDYRLTANDYQQAAKNPVVLQSWIAYLPADMRDVHVKRFFNEMCFTNNVKILRLLNAWGLRVERFAPEFLPRLIRRAKNNNYQELVCYLSELTTIF